MNIIWSHWAAGKLRFTIGNEFVELPFADWASRLKAPTWSCPHSGQPTFHLAATDDGRIVAAEEIATCEKPFSECCEASLSLAAPPAVKFRANLPKSAPSLNALFWPTK